MAYIFIEDFRAGMDRRRDIASAPPGSLWLLKNAVITRGGEIERSRAFTTQYSLPAGTFGLHGVQNRIYVFGSVADPGVPTGVLYQRLQHTDTSVAMNELIWSESFDGNIYAIARFEDGAIFHYYNETRVSDWDAIASAVGSNTTIATALKVQINQSALYDASSSGADVTVTAATAGTAFTYSESAVDYGVVNDQTLTPAVDQANVPEVLATGSIDVLTGTSNPGANTVADVTIGGVDALGSVVDHTGSNTTTAAAVAAQINTYTSTPDYTATSSGATVTITATAGSGAGINGAVVASSGAGDVTMGNAVNMNSGVTALKQQITWTVGGTFEAPDIFTITLGATAYKTSGAASGMGLMALTHKDKVYSTTTSLLEFCDTADPTVWLDPLGAAAGTEGFVNMSTQEGGNENLTSVETYEGNIAVFSENAIQIWFVEANDDNNVFVQTLKSTGTQAPASVRQYGARDLFYMAASGFRSIRARDSSNAAYTNDVGTPIDDYVIEHFAELTEGQISAATAVVEPTSSRYWCALDDRIYVYSNFPGSKIAAWSIFEPGFVVDSFAAISRSLYARSGDTIYLYGGSDGGEWGTQDVSVQLTFLNAGKPATKKSITGFDMSGVNTWGVKILLDPKDLEVYAPVGEVTGFTYDSPDTGAGPADITHFGLELTCAEPGEARLSNLCVHYEMSGDE